MVDMNPNEMNAYVSQAIENIDNLMKSIDKLTGDANSRIQPHNNNQTAEPPTENEHILGQTEKYLDDAAQLDNHLAEAERNAAAANNISYGSFNAEEIAKLNAAMMGGSLPEVEASIPYEHLPEWYGDERDLAESLGELEKISDSDWNKLIAPGVRGRARATADTQESQKTAASVVQEAADDANKDADAATGSIGMDVNGTNGMGP